MQWHPEAFLPLSVGGVYSILNFKKWKWDVFVWSKEGNKEYWEPLVCHFFVECFRILQRRCGHETSLNVYVLLALSLMLTTALSYQEMLCMYKVYELYWCGVCLNNLKLDVSTPGCTDRQALLTQDVQALGAGGGGRGMATRV